MTIGADSGRWLPAHRRLLANQMAIAVIINMAMAALMSWLLSDPAQAAGGRLADALVEMANGTFGAAMGVVPPVTLSIRKRVREGAVPRLAGRRFLPRNLILRIVAVGAMAMAVIGLPAAWLLSTLFVDAPPTLGAFLAFKTAYGAIFALVATPFILIAALRDR